MKRLLWALLALCIASGSADARALVIRNRGYTAGTEGGINALMTPLLPMLNTLGGDYRVVNIEDARQGATQAIRRGAWYNGEIGSAGDSALYNPIIIVGDDQSSYTQNMGAGFTVAPAVSGYSLIRTGTANTFTFLRPGMLISGTGITGFSVIVGIDSIGQKMRVAGTVAGADNSTLAFSTALRPDSLTRTICYPKVTIIRIGNQLASGSFNATAACSAGVSSLLAYIGSTHIDSTANVYEVGNPSRTWKSRVRVPALATRDTRGWRPLLGCLTTRQNNPGYAGGNYDFPDPVCSTCAFSTNPDTVAAWAVMNWGSDGTPIGGNAKPNVYCFATYIFGIGAIEPAILLSVLAWGDSLSGGGLFGNSQQIPRRMAFHIDDGWKRGESRFGNTFGPIGCDDTTAFKASIDSLASLQIPFVVGVELDSLNSVLLSAGVTGNGDLYDKRWWARAPLVHYTPHCHAGLSNGANRSQNVILAGTGANKYLRPLDLFGLTRYRNAFGTTDSTLAYGLPDYVNEAIMDSGSYYWLGKRAKFLCDSAFGSGRTDRLVMPPGDDWTTTNIKHTVSRQWGAGIDSVAAATVAIGMTGIRTNNNNVVGNADSAVTNNYGYYPGWRRIYLPHSASGSGDHPAGMPTWMPANLYGRPCDIVPTNGYPSSTANSQASSVASWSHNRNSYGGDAFLLGLLCDRTALTGDPGGQRAVYVLSSHASDFGSSGLSGEATRPQFYTFKYVTNAIRTANAHARRPLVQIVYPQEVTP